MQHYEKYHDEMLSTKKVHNELRDYSLKNHGFLTVENGRYAKLSNSAELTQDLNFDVDAACLSHYRSIDVTEKSLCQLKEFDCVEPFNYDIIDDDLPKDNMI